MTHRLKLATLAMLSTMALGSWQTAAAQDRCPPSRYDRSADRGYRYSQQYDDRYQRSGNYNGSYDPYRDGARYGHNDRTYDGRYYERPGSHSAAIIGGGAAAGAAVGAMAGGRKGAGYGALAGGAAGLIYDRLTRKNARW